MLSADQIDALRDVAGEMMDPVVEFLIADIADRVKTAGQLTSTAAYKTWILQTLGVGQKELKKELAKRLGLTREEVGRLMKQAAQVGYDFDISRFPTAGAVPFEQNTSIQQIVAAAVEMAGKELDNLTRTMGFVGHDGKVDGLTDAYRKACDYAFTKTVTGAQDYNSAIRQAVKGLAEKGILTIDYKSGTHRSIEVAVRDSVMGGLGLMDEKICQQNHDDLGCDGWEISAHHASAPDHEPFQGKQYPDAKYKRLNGSLRRRIGTLGCGHSAMGVIIGVMEPQYTDEELEEMRQENERGVTVDGKHYTLYQATQRQRSFERKIRKQKKKLLLDEKLGDEEKLQTDRIRYQVLSQEYRRFSKATGQKLRHERLEVAGFGPKQANAAKAAEKVAMDIAADNTEALKFFGADSADDLKSIVKRSTMKTKGGFACFPDGDLLNRNIKKVPPLETHFDVAMHGSPIAVGFGSTEANMSARTLAAIIRHSKGYTGQKIRLLSCSTGKILDDRSCFAEDLANALGVEVIAPNDTLYISRNGDLRVGEYGDGAFISFIPNQRRRIK